MAKKQGTALLTLALLLVLAACGDSTTKTAEMTATYQQLSQVDWTEMTAAPTAARVTNNNLIMMR